MARYDISDAEWQLICDLFPGPKATGRPPKNNRQMLNGIFWKLCSGAPWRDLPEEFGPWQTVYDHFNHWCNDGVFINALKRLQSLLDELGVIDWHLWSVDGSNVRAARCAAGAGSKRGELSPMITRWAALAEDLEQRSTS